MILTDIPNEVRKRRLKAHNNYLTHNEKILLSERLHADYDITLKYAALQGYLSGSGNDKWKVQYNSRAICRLAFITKGRVRPIAAKSHRLK